MTDTLSKEERSRVMAKVKSRDTKPEKKVRSMLFSLGFRFRLCQKNLPGKPDIVLKKYKTVVFVHGCFWHGHENCRKARIPKSNVEFWKNKIERNKQRFDEVAGQLRAQGWKVVVVWECEIEKDFENTMRKLIAAIEKNA
ncbi:MAG TPA: very short patch repair endonuclease [Alphaproteobacteria bacterium]|nr:very short patch repair endonuclease [Alphaproteobacteria bacterium]